MAVAALQNVMSKGMGPCVFDAGGWFPETQSEEGPVDIAGLMQRARRMPELVVVMTIEEKVARDRVCDEEALDKEQEQFNEDREKKVAEREEYIASMEGVEGWVAEEDPKAAEIPEWDPEGDPLAQRVVYGALKRKDVTGLDPDGRKAALAEESGRQKEKLEAFATALRELRATVTDVNGGVKWATEAASSAAVEREIHRVAKPFVEEREDLLTRSQGAKVSTTEAAKLRAIGSARYSVLGVANAADPRLPVYGTPSCALFRDRVYLFGDEP